MKKHYLKILYDNDLRVSRAMKQQIRDENNRFYGGFMNDYGVVMVKHTAYRVMALITAYCHSESAFFQEKNVLKAIINGLNYIENKQYDSGLFDYETCNFEAAPDTAFIIKKMLPVYIYLDNKDRDTDQEKIYLSLKSLITSGANGLLTGGFHTPNHRWAIASVLALCYKLFKNRGYKESALSYLKEGIDCNEDGEFAERSAGNYNRINDDAMIMLSEGLDEPEYEEYAIRNLTMMEMYFEPDFSVFTANSTRFDKDLLVYPKDYYWLYLSLGYKYQRKDFLCIADHIMNVVTMKNLRGPDCLIHFMNHPELIDMDIQPAYELEEKARYFSESGIGRYISQQFSCSVLKGKHNFLYVNSGSIQMEMKLGGSFFEHRGFKAEEMTFKQGLFSMKQIQKGWYYLPFEESQDTSDWWEMDHSKRKIKEAPNLTVAVDVKPYPDRVEIRMKTEGITDAPFRVEMAFRGIERIESDAFCMEVKGDEEIVVKEGYVKVESMDDGLLIGPSFGNHRFISGKEDSDLKHPGCATLYFTDYVPFDRVITIKHVD